MSIPHFHVDPARSAGKRILSILPALALVVTLAACDSNGGENFNISTYSGEAYAGSAEGTATRPGGEARIFATGNASVQVDSLSETEARLTIQLLNIAAFSAEGTYDSNGASFVDGEDNNIEISADGGLSGSLEIFGYQTLISGDISGQATSNSFDLETRTVLTEPEGDDPTDTEVRLVLELNR